MVNFRFLTLILSHFNFAGALNAIVFGLDKDTASRLTPSQIRVSVSTLIFII